MLCKFNVNSMNAQLYDAASQPSREMVPRSVQPVVTELPPVDGVRTDGKIRPIDGATLNFLLNSPQFPCFGHIPGGCGQGLHHRNPKRTRDIVLAQCRPREEAEQARRNNLTDKEKQELKMKRNREIARNCRKRKREKMNALENELLRLRQLNAQPVLLHGDRLIIGSL